MSLPMQGGTTPTIPDELYDFSVTRVPSSTGTLVGRAFGEAVRDSPVSSIYRMSELNVLRKLTEDDEKVDQDTFSRVYGNLGLEWDDRMSWAVAEELASRKRTERQNRVILSNGRGGIVQGATIFGSQLVGSLIDPVNIAMSFIPIVSAPRYAQLSARTGGAISKLNRGLISAPGLVSKADAGSTWARFQIGVIDGFAGSIIAEPITALARTGEQADYAMTDFLNNILIGTALSGGLHAGIGKASDIYSSFKMKQVLADNRTTELAAKQMVDGQRVNISPVRQMDDAEITVLDTGLDVDSRLTNSDITFRSLELGQIPDVEVISRSKGSVSVRFANDTGHTLTAVGKNKAEATSNLVGEYQRLKMTELSGEARGTADDLKGQLDQKVSERNRLKAAINRSPEDVKGVKELEGQLERLNSPDAFDLKMRELGYPIEAANELQAKIKNAEKRFKQSEAAEAQKQLNDLKSLFDDFIKRNERGRFAEAKQLLSRERNSIRKQLDLARAGGRDILAVRKRINAVNKEINDIVKKIEKRSLSDAQTNLRNMNNPENRLFPPTRQDPEIEAKARKAAPDDDVQAQIKKLDEEEIPINRDALPEAIRKDLEEIDTFVKDLESLTDAQKRGIDCMAGNG